MLDKYGKGTPDDWIEQTLYTRKHWWGVIAMLLTDILLFGALWGLLAWVCMAIWLPVFGNVINGIGHALGYRNFDTKENSHNIIPLGIWIVGEELHNNHHADPRSANFRAKWYEFDIGWVYIKLLSWLKLANVLYARTLNAREFAEKYYARAAHAANVAAGELSAAAERAARVATAAKGELSAAAERAARAANAAAGELSAKAGELSAAAEQIASPKPIQLPTN
jgi:hypothetical protein